VDQRFLRFYGVFTVVILEKIEGFQRVSFDWLARLDLAKRNRGAVGLETLRGVVLKVDFADLGLSWVDVVSELLVLVVFLEDQQQIYLFDGLVDEFLAGGEPGDKVLEGGLPGDAEGVVNGGDIDVHL